MDRSRDLSCCNHQYCHSHNLRLLPQCRCRNFFAFPAGEKFTNLYIINWSWDGNCNYLNFCWFLVVFLVLRHLKVFCNFLNNLLYHLNLKIFLPRLAYSLSIAHVRPSKRPHSLLDCIRRTCMAEHSPSPQLTEPWCNRASLGKSIPRLIVFQHFYFSGYFRIFPGMTGFKRIVWKEEGSVWMFMKYI